MRLLAAAALFAACFLFDGGAAAAPSQSDLESCRQAEDLDRRIAGCTKIVQDRGTSKEIRVGAYNNRGLAYRWKREYDRAIADFGEALKLDPKYAAGYNNRGLAYSSKEDFERAIADFNEAIRLNPKYALAFSNRGAAYFDRNEYDRAIADLDKAIALDPKSGAAYRVRAMAYHNKREYERAVADYNMALPLIPEGFKANILINRLNALAELKQHAAGAVDLITLAKEHPKEVQSVQQRRIYSIVNYLREQKRNEDALSILLWLKRADYRGGSDAVALNDGLNPLLIGQYVRLRRAEEAVPHIAELAQYSNLIPLAIDKENEELWANPKLQAVLQLKDFPARQLVASQRLVLQHPKSLRAVYDLVNSLRLNGRYAEAAKAGQDSLGNLAAYDKTPEQEAWLRNAVADALISDGRFDEANATLRPLLEGDAKKSNFLVNQFINLGGLLRNQGRFQESMDTAQRARGSSSPYGEKFIQAIFVCGLSRTGRAAEAEAAMAEMLKSAADNHGATFNALLCLKREGEAAALFVKLLQSEDSRPTLLLDSQDCLENPKRPAFAREMRSVVLKVRDRPEVRKALEAVGRIVNEPVACGDRYRLYGW
jgi:tetratricopeptide (TPR) repeat protein